MKNISSFILVLILIITSCSNDDDSNNDPVIESMNNFVLTNFDVSTTPNTRIDSTYYQLANNRIDYSEGINFQTNETSSGTYIYDNDKISEIRRYSQSNLIEKLTFEYSNSNTLTEFLHETTQEQSIYNKHTFTYSSDSIYVNWKRSFDGINFDIDVAHSKIVLDSNNNRVYFENFNFLNNTTKAVITQYDSNNNPIKEEFLHDSGTGLELDFTNTITFENSINTLYEVNETTFSRHTLMLLYHIDSGEVNNFNFKSISPNNIKTFESDFGSLFTYSVLHVINEERYSELTEFATFSNSDLFSAFSYEFFE
ncbi:hypothetical protein [uncultured Aquimarina sp.]|uniref:hypothetical protein n=1 Tax=uncultured Aquimarina sp. TaxID=575652 RepID=UPI00263A3097|nr:hypothetical protein [uncultured Aquimarina sp.]